MPELMQKQKPRGSRNDPRRSRGPCATLRAASGRIVRPTPRSGSASRITPHSAAREPSRPASATSSQIGPVVDTARRQNYLYRPPASDPVALSNGFPVGSFVRLPRLPEPPHAHAVPPDSHLLALGVAVLGLSTTACKPEVPRVQEGQALQRGLDEKCVDGMSELQDRHRLQRQGLTAPTGSAPSSLPDPARSPSAAGADISKPRRPSTAPAAPCVWPAPARLQRQPECRPAPATWAPAAARPVKAPAQCQTDDQCEMDGSATTGTACSPAFRGRQPQPARDRSLFFGFDSPASARRREKLKASPVHEDNAPAGHPRSPRRLPRHRGTTSC
jgi:hypothetical protein